MTLKICGLEANPWIIADDFHSFRSNRQITTTLEKHFDIRVDDPLCRKRPDFFMVLGDAASCSDDKQSRFLFIELKGPHSPLIRAHQNQAVGDATIFMEHKPGFSFIVLLGVDFGKPKPDFETASQGVYAFQSMTYKRLIERARFRLGYMSEGVEATKAEELARKFTELNAREIETLLDS